MHLIRICFVNRCGEWCFWEGKCLEQPGRHSVIINLLPCKVWSHIWDTSWESWHNLLCQQVWRMMLMRRRMQLMTDWRVGMHNGCAQQVYFWPMVVKFGPRGSQVMKKRKILSDFWVKYSLGCFKISNWNCVRNPKSNILIFAFLIVGFAEF